MKNRIAFFCAVVGTNLPGRALAHEGHGNTFIHALLHSVQNNPLLGGVIALCAITVGVLAVHAVRARDRNRKDLSS
jgi:hypothetical protein